MSVYEGLDEWQDRSYQYVRIWMGGKIGHISMLGFGWVAR